MRKYQDSRKIYVTNDNVNVPSEMQTIRPELTKTFCNLVEAKVSDFWIKDQDTK